MQISEMKQSELIKKGDWDILVILDAMRYDYFSIAYKFFFNGFLRPVISPSYYTTGWVKATFNNLYLNDTIYLSANPVINSRIPIEGFYAKEHFYDIIDIWDYCWDEEIGTIHPFHTTEVASKIIELYPRRRYIIHYIQPHEPYLILGRGIGYTNKYMGVLERKNCKTPQSYFNTLVFFRLLRRIPNPLWGRVLFWDIKKIVKLPPSRPMETVYRVYGIEGLRKAYLYNVIIVMYYVHKLISRLLGINDKLRIVITADHGELLGEKGLYDHTSRGKNDALLRIVPWFVVSSIKNINLNMPTYDVKHTNDCIERVIQFFILRERIKALRRHLFR